MQSDWQGEYQAMVLDCERRDSLLDAWERSFLLSLRQSLDRALFVPSPRQVAKLEEIWERVTAEMPDVPLGNADLFADHAADDKRRGGI